MLGTLGIFCVALFGFARAPNFFSHFRRDRVRIECGWVVVLDDSGCKKPFLSGECCKFVENLNRQEKNCADISPTSGKLYMSYHLMPPISSTHGQNVQQPIHPSFVASTGPQPHWIGSKLALDPIGTKPPGARFGPGEQQSLVAIHARSPCAIFCPRHITKWGVRCQFCSFWKWIIGYRFWGIPYVGYEHNNNQPTSTSQPTYQTNKQTSKTNQNKKKQNKTKQNKAKQSKAKQNKTTVPTHHHKRERNHNHNLEPPPQQQNH